MENLTTRVQQHNGVYSFIALTQQNKNDDLLVAIH